MKKWWQSNSLVFIIFFIWRLGLVFIEWFAPRIWPLRPGFLGPTPWANLDGVHYLSIAQNGYYQFEQAFFPLYPLLIRYLGYGIPLPAQIIALGISHISFLIGLYFFYQLLTEYDKKKALWAVIFLLLFPTSFYFASVYNESLFFLLASGTLYAAQKKRWWLAGILGMFAGATRLFGIFLFPVVLFLYYPAREKSRGLINFLPILLIPLGVLAYMAYLQSAIGDPLAFFHAQPAFGAGRSGSALILLPQVIWRYLKIFATVPVADLTYQVAIFELLTLMVGIGLCWWGWRRRNLRVFILYSLAVLIAPTLTGTLSSLPRYFLSAFPLFFVLASVHNTRLKVALAVIFGLGLVYFASAFLRGYFIA